MFWVAEYIRLKARAWHFRIKFILRKYLFTAAPVDFKLCEKQYV